MSMDFVYDLTEKLQDQRIEYFLVTVRKGKVKDTADVFYYLEDTNESNSLCQAIENSYFILKTTTAEDEKVKNEPIIDQSKPAKKRAKKQSKKSVRKPRKKKGDDDSKK